MISSDEAIQVLKSLSSNTVAFVSKEGARLLADSGRIKALSEESFWIYSQNGMVGFEVPLKGNGATFDVSAPIFVLSEKERAAIPVGAQLSEGLLIDFTEDDRWIFLIVPPRGW